MPVLKIVGYETGKAKKDLAALLSDRLGLDGAEARKMFDAIVDGRGITLTIDDEETAAGLGQELDEAGAKVLLET
ncbi:MAG: hypothetical protein DWQ47_09440 [Acidobacteria bacterium]|nr:MAG: hypothetical protein DWQ32_17540 [Acidobacteriota bacterium]REJ98876.1 MAG: hypothetical protein DWQ38_12435 [Acidobacteriota bacterium]REK16404.1 MAG: hypothetical protein DWQ43_05250 [Acidobacteriota bacterium]REK44085.1 MAG: hypothetical protein DWQ47_09440 [Acidobacteriota bacterium]